MNEYDKLEQIQRDRVRRNKLLNEQYSYSERKKLSKQFGFTEIDDPDFIDFMIPPGTTPKGFGDDLGYDDFDPDNINNPGNTQKPNPANSFGDDLGYDDFEPDGSPSDGKFKPDDIKSTIYADILKSNGQEYTQEHPKIVQTAPTDDEREAGVIIRYFLQQSNSPTAPIYEVDKEQFEEWAKEGGAIDNGFYNGALMRWRIRGNLETVVEDNGVIIRGVLEGNQNSIDLASETLPDLKNQITNLVKYWRR
tara:strand:- start:41 stop:790 length:750 start_codon:yes stop_codon:yes gene_type:complete